MPLKVGVELQIHAVTCPGVFLPEKHDIYLSVCILGQYKETECLPPVFPLLFHEKMLFEKVFESAVDPAAVTEMLESNVTRFELTQLVSSVGDDLAFYEENTRDFLFPEPKLTPAYPGVDRELLMKTSSHFPGIAPKIEFSTRTTITELPLQRREKNYIIVQQLISLPGPKQNKESKIWICITQTKEQVINTMQDISEKALTFDNCETSNTSVKIVREPAEQAASEHDSSSLETDELFSYPQCSPSWRHLAFHHAASPATSQRLKSPSPVRSPSPLQYRLQIHNQNQLLEQHCAVRVQVE
ncbi:spermatogenesis associated 6-like protein isoform X7 [Apteryx rowi]|uniref:spermatogenesis associated 6-like protein isoform X7 n=1 Tax=Apteryx rowi TaxID=308060 RepID=UPI000E1DBC54|nr:spermatogenesis associated 6-like protein isoform X7 [Apteryx rowi]